MRINDVFLHQNFIHAKKTVILQYALIHTKKMMKGIINILID